MRALLLNIFTAIIVVSTVALITIAVLIFINPLTSLNPFPPAVATVAHVIPTVQPSPTIQPLVAPSETPVPPSPTPTSTSTISPSLTPTATSIYFAVIGDYGLAGPAEADVARLVRGWNPDLIITTGDNNYPGGSARTIDQNIGQYYADFIFPYQGSYSSTAVENRFFPSLGNHDWYTSSAQPYLDYFTLPGRERYYSFTFGPVSFFALDSDTREPDGTSGSSLQAQWLQLSLAASESVWNIVYFHHAPYSSGMHGSTERMQWPFARWGASAVISGHDHLYERLLIDGLLYFTNGAGGKSLYTFGDALPGSEARYNADYGAMLVEANSTSLHFQFINRLGKTIDEYTLTLATPTPQSTLLASETPSPN